MYKVTTGTTTIMVISKQWLHLQAPDLNLTRS